MGAERRNVRRVSAGEGMSSMADSMNTAADTLANCYIRAERSTRLECEGCDPIASHVVHEACS